MSSRALSAAEIRLVRSVFGDSIDVSKVRLEYSPLLLVNGGIVIRGAEKTATIYTSFDPTRGDFASNNTEISLRGFFIHEMTHVWQIQTGKMSYVEGAFIQAREALGGRSGYLYSREDFQSGFENLNIEQQAQVIRHYYYQQQGMSREQIAQLESRGGRNYRADDIPTIGELGGFVPFIPGPPLVITPQPRCFLPGTPILMADGTEKPIELIYPF